MLNSVGMFEERGKKVGNLVEKCEVLSVFYRQFNNGIDVLNDTSPLFSQRIC